MEGSERLLTFDDVDRLLDGCLASLAPAVESAARDLPRTLGLAPVANLRWSEVFGHLVTLAAPALVAEAFPRVDPAMVEDATVAHALSVICAFANDRIEDGQVTPSPALTRVMADLGALRDARLRRVDPTSAEGEHERATGRAITEERRLLRARFPVSFERYEELSRAKQQVGLVASVALAKRAGAAPRRARAVARALEDVALGLQAFDDVVDWEDDLGRGGAWAVAIASGRASTTAPEALGEARALVLSTSVLRDLLGLSRRAYTAAERRARALGLSALAGWAAERRLEATAHHAHEARSPGFTLRVRALRGWAAEVGA